MKAFFLIVLGAVGILLYGCELASIGVGIDEAIQQENYHVFLCTDKFTIEGPDDVFNESCSPSDPSVDQPAVTYNVYLNDTLASSLGSSFFGDKGYEWILDGNLTWVSKPVSPADPIVVTSTALSGTGTIILKAVGNCEGNEAGKLVLATKKITFSTTTTIDFVFDLCLDKDAGVAQGSANAIDPKYSTMDYKWSTIPPGAADLSPIDAQHVSIKNATVDFQLSLEKVGRCTTVSSVKQIILTQLPGCH